MRIFAASLISIASVALANAAEIIGWKAPLSNLAYEGVEATGVDLLKKAPEKSPFFGEKDVLWNVRSVLPDEAASAEWAVWNETSGRIVVKGSWTVMREMEERIDTASQCRITVEAFRVAEDGGTPDFSKQPEASISLVTRSGQKASGSRQGDDSAMKLEAEPTMSEERDFVDLRMVVFASLHGASDLEIQTGLSFKADDKVWVGRDFDGKTGIDLRVSAAIETPDGTPYAEIMMRQEGSAAVPFRVDRSGRKPIAIEGGGQLVSAWLDFRLAKEFITGVKVDETDPFAVDPDAEPAPDLDGLPTANVPEKLEPYFGGEVLDMREIIRKMGVLVGENDFVGFDFRSQRVFIFSKDEDVLDMFEQLFTPFCCLPPPDNVAVTLQETGQRMLIGRSGQKAGMTSTQPETKRTCNFEIEPTSNGDTTLVDLRAFYEEKLGEEVTKNFNTAVTLVAGDFLEIMTTKAPDGTESAMKIKAEIRESP